MMERMTHEQLAPITVLAADDHRLIRAGIAAVLAATDDLLLVAEAADGAEAVARYRRTRPDVVLMDVRMPVLDGVAAARAILTDFPAASIIMLASFGGDDDTRRALDAGARAWLLKDRIRADLVETIRRVHAAGLTD
jgi:two-component system NarL family response regulator